MPNTRFNTDPRTTNRSRCRQPLAAQPSAAPAARRFVTAQLREWGLDHTIVRVGIDGDEKAPLAEAAELVVAELVANSVAETTRIMSTPDTDDVSSHDAPTLEVQLRTTDDRLLCEVWDASPVQPVPTAPVLEAENGRGLLLIRCYATGWTCYPSPSGQGKVTAAWWDLTDAAEDAGSRWT